jgi:hypothetical protein
MESFNPLTLDQLGMDGESVDLFSLIGEMDKTRESVQSVPVPNFLSECLPLLNCAAPVIDPDPRLLSQIVLTPTEQEEFNFDWNMSLRGKLQRSTHESVVNECMILHHMFKQLLPAEQNVEGELYLFIQGSFTVTLRYF